MVEARETTSESALQPKTTTDAQKPSDRTGFINRLRNLRGSFKRAEKPPDVDTSTIPDYLNNTLWHISKDVKAKKPEIGSTVDIALHEIDKQAVENFTQYESKTYPGTIFTFSKLTLTPEIIKRIAAENPNAALNNPPSIENPTTPENDITVDFGYFLLPPQGHALDAIDMATDRYMRKIAKVAHAMRNGETPPNVEIYFVGSATGFGGKVSPEFQKAVAKDGFNTIGKMYGEFISEVILKDKDPDQTHVLLQGGSMGAPTADRTLPFVDYAFKDNTQLLLDVPAGHHKPGIIGTPTKGLQAPIGLAAETAARMAFDERTKDKTGRSKRLIEKLKTEKGIKDDDPYLRRLKTMLWDTGTKLVKGTPLSYERGTFIRNATRDPLSTGFGRKHLIERDLGKTVTTHSGQQTEVKVPFWQTGHALETSVDSTHFWFYNRRFDRWQQNLKYCQAPSKSPAETATAIPTAKP